MDDETISTPLDLDADHDVAEILEVPDDAVDEIPDHGEPESEEA